MADCCSTPGLLTVKQALQQILSNITPAAGSELLPVKQALTRVLQSNIKSAINVPSFDNSAMDGYALPYPQNESMTHLVIGTSWAGRPFTGNISKGECIRIFTGAKVPKDCDCVVMQENVSIQNKHITVNQQPKTGANIRRIGEDTQVGAPLLPIGTKLRAAEIGLIASCGIANISVFRRIKIAFFSTGDELKPLGAQLEDGQIYDSNRYSLNALIQETGAEPIDMGVIADNPEAVEKALLNASQNADIVITTGGVSVGDADFITDVVRKIGHLDLWKIAMKPGKPLAFGSIGNCTFFGLPGNPVSAMVTFDQIVRPAIKHMMGIIDSKPTLKLQAIALAPLRKSPGRVEFQRGVVKTIEGQLFVEPTGVQGSHMLTSMSQANCYIVLEQDCTGINKNELVTIQIMKDYL